MVVTYLENIYSDLLEEKIRTEQEQNDIITKMNERLKYIERLKEEDEKNFDAFSPRKQNINLRQEIKNLENEQNICSDSLNKKKQELIEIDSKIAELNSVLKIAKEQIAANEKIVENNIDENEIFKIKLLETQELERQRIARELHDSSVQCLTSLVHKTEFCTKLIDVDPIRCRLELSSMSKNLKKIIEEMRQMIYDLHPMPLDDIGFDAVVERDLFKIKQQGVINTNYFVEGIPYKIKPVIALTLRRVIQESCNNVLKHANASLITVTLCYKEKFLKIIISDDGNGISIEEDLDEIKDDNSGFGLSFMKERIYLLSGKLSIDTQAGEGTKVIIEIPVDRGN